MSEFQYPIYHILHAGATFPLHVQIFCNLYHCYCASVLLNTSSVLHIAWLLILKHPAQLKCSISMVWWFDYWYTSATYVSNCIREVEALHSNSSSFTSLPIGNIIHWSACSIILVNLCYCFPYSHSMYPCIFCNSILKSRLTYKAQKKKTYFFFVLQLKLLLFSQMNAPGNAQPSKPYLLH